MPDEVEISSLDLRYEHLRLRHRKQEGRLLSSIAERGIEEAMEGVDVQGTRVLLNGFKRWRCARKLGMATVPYRSLGEDQPTAIVALLRLSSDRTLGILEQAGFIDELRTLQQLSVAEIAELLSRSKGWVSMRMGLSVRDIEQLAHGYFRGPESFREQIQAGNIALPLSALREGSAGSDECSSFERALLKDLEITGRYMQRVIGKSVDPRLKTHVFHAEANLLCAGILGCSEAFIQTMRQLYDRRGQA